MHSLKRVLAFSAVTISSIFAWALPAQAGEAGFDCVITGHADANVLLVGGTGTYGFTEFTTLCAGAATTDKQDSAATTVLDITSNGTFTNSVCGTGEVSDDDPSVVATGTSANLDAKIEAADASYTIDFDAFQGTLTFTNAGSGAEVTGGGAISLSPDGDVVNAPQCVDGFNVVGDVAGVIG